MCHNVGNNIIHNELNIQNVNLEYGNWYDIEEDTIGKYDGIISFQTLSWLPGYKEEIKCLSEYNANWIAMSSLFFEGDIDFDIVVKEYNRNDTNAEYRKSYYNVYSLQRIKEEFYKYGYKNFNYKKFDIDVYIPIKSKSSMCTYTIKTVDGNRIQISGALLMPWYFILAYKL